MSNDIALHWNHLNSESDCYLRGSIMKLNEKIKWLKSHGCYPSIYRRGDVWRTHVNAAGNFWADARTPLKALEDAVKLWQDKGCPMDGMAMPDNA